MVPRSPAAALALLLLGAGAARADENPYARPALYGSLGGSVDLEHMQDHVGIPGLPLSLDNSLGFALRLGYRVHPNWAGEMEIDVVDGFNGEVGTLNTSIDVVTATLNARGYLPWGRFQPYLTLGAGYMNLDSGDSALVDDGNSPVLRFGSGIDTYLTDNLALYLGWDYLLPFGDNAHLDFLAVHWGFQYMLRFEEP